MRTFHIDLKGALKLKCEECEKLFQRNYKLNNHMELVHTYVSSSKGQFEKDSTYFFQNGHFKKIIDLKNKVGIFFKLKDRLILRLLLVKLKLDRLNS